MDKSEDHMIVSVFGAAIDVSRASRHQSRCWNCPKYYQLIAIIKTVHGTPSTASTMMLSIFFVNRNLFLRRRFKLSWADSNDDGFLVPVFNVISRTWMVYSSSWTTEISGYSAVSCFPIGCETALSYNSPWKAARLKASSTTLIQRWKISNDQSATCRPKCFQPVHSNIPFQVHLSDLMSILNKIWLNFIILNFPPSKRSHS